MRKLVIGLGGLLVLLVAAALIAPSLIEWNRYKSEIAQRVKAETGRDLIIAGDLDLDVLPTPHLRLTDARLSNIPGASTAEMIRLKSLDMRIALLPLLRGRVEIASVTLVEPLVVLETLADGRNNWTIRSGTPAAEGTAAAAPRDGSSAAAPQAFRLDSLRIQRGTLIWRDAAEKSEERLEHIDAELQARSLSGPYQARGSLAVRGVPLAIVLSAGTIPANGGATPVSITLVESDGGAKAEFAGTLAGPVESARLNGKLDISAADLGRLVARASGASSPVAPLQGRPLALSSRLTASPQGGSLGDLEIEIGRAHLSGEARFSFDDRIHAETKLRAGRIDLTPWIDAPAAAPPAGGAALAVPGSAATPPNASGAPSFALPSTLDATLDLSVDAITYGSEAIQDVRLAAQLANGQLALRQASLRLPGGGDASLTGTLAARDGRPTFDGALDARSDNLRSVLGWMKLDLNGVPADRLRKFALSARVRGDDQQVQVLGAKISLDTSRIDAGVTLALRQRLAFGANVTVDQLNLDAYRLHDSPAPATAPAAALPRSSAASSGAGPGPLAMLTRFDANLRLQIGTLTWRRTQTRDIRFDGTLAQGTLAIREAAIGNLAGTAARLNGTLSGFERVPSFRGGFSADSTDISGVLRMAGIEPAASVRSLGRMSLRGKADGSAERITFDALLDASGGKLTVSGTVDGLPSVPRVDMKLSGDHPDPARLAAAFGLDIPADRKLGPLALSATLKGDEKVLRTDLDLKALGGAAALAGTVSDPLAGAPGYEMTLTVSHPEMAGLVRSVASYQPAGREIGPLKLEARLKGTPAAADLTGFQLRAGKVNLSGGGRLALDGARPKLHASLTGNEIDLNPFLPAEKALPRAPVRGGLPGPGGGAPQPPTEHFSAEPFDLSALAGFDADLSVGAEALVWRQFRIERPVVKAMLADSLLTIDQLAGRMFEGTFLMKGRLNAKSQPTIDGTVSIDKANVGKALFEAASFDVAGGTMDFSMAIDGSGASPRALVSALNGQGKIDVRNGVVKGFDLKAVSERLKNIDRGLDILTLFGAAMGGGETRFSSLAGTFRIDKGVLRTSDLTLLAEAGEGRATGQADLPRWTMDFRSEFRLTEHPKTPPFGMTVRGPIDNPQRVFQIQELQGYLLQRGVGTLLRKVLPDARQADQPQPQPAPDSQQPQQQQQKPLRPEEILRDLLQGLGR